MPFHNDIPVLTVMAGKINICSLNKYTNEDFSKYLLPFSDSGGPLSAMLSFRMCSPQSRCLWAPGGGEDQNGGGQLPRTAINTT